MRTRSFHGEAAANAAAPLEECFALLAAVDRYPDWCPDVVREVQVLDRGAGGEPRRVRMTIHVEWAAIVREFQLFLAVAVEPPRAVTLSRVTDHPTNQVFTARWLLEPADGTRITLGLDADLRVPAYVPADGIADKIAQAFVAAATQALSARQPYVAGQPYVARQPA